MSLWHETVLLSWSLEQFYGLIVCFFVFLNFDSKLSVYLGFSISQDRSYMLWQTLRRNIFIKTVWSNSCILCKIRGLLWNSTTGIKHCVSTQATFSSGLLYFMTWVVGRGYFMLLPTVLSINIRQHFDIFPILLLQWMFSCWFSVLMGGQFNKKQSQYLDIFTIPAFNCLFIKIGWSECFVLWLSFVICWQGKDYYQL